MEEKLSLTSHFHFIHTIKLRHEREVDKRCEHVKWPRRSLVFLSSRAETVKKAKAHLDLNLARNVNHNSKVFYKYMNSKRKMRAHCWMELGNQWQQTQGRMRYSMPSLPQTLSGKTAFRNPRPLRPGGKFGARKTRLPSVKKDQIRERINKGFLHKLESAEGVADVTMRPPSWRWGNTPKDWNRLHINPVFKKSKKEYMENCGPFSTTSVSRKMTNNCSWKALPHRWMTRRWLGIVSMDLLSLCLTSLPAFYNMVTSLMDEGRTVDGVYLNFSKVLDTVPCNTTTDKPTKYRLDKWTMKCIKKWLNNRAQCCSTSSLIA